MAKINTVFGFTDEVTNPLKRMIQNVERSERSFSSLALKLTGVNSALQIVSSSMMKVKEIGTVFGSFVSEAGQYQMLLSRLNVAFGNYEEAEKYFKDIQNFAKNTPFDVKGVTNAFIMLKNAGMEADSLLGTISMIGDLAQGNNQAFNNMALNMMQIKASGKATAQDIKQFATFGVPIVQALKDIGREGDYSFEAVYQAMVKLTSEGGKFYNSMGAGSRTLEGRMANLQDSISQFKNSIGKNILPAVQSLQASMAGFFEDLTDYVNKLNIVTIRMADGSIKEINRLEQFFMKLRDSIDSVIAIIIELSTVAVIAGATMATAWAVANWPITVGIVLITTFLRVLFDLTQASNDASIAMNGFANQCAGAGAMFGMVVGFISGLIGGLMNIIYNVIALVYNAIIYVSEFILNIFTHPINAIARLFIDLGNIILQVLSTIAGVIDLIFNTSMSESLNKASRQIEAFKEKNFGNVNFKYQKLELKDVQGIYSATMKGGDIAGSIGDMIDKNLSGYNKLVEELGNKFTFDSNGNVNVSDQSVLKIADNMEELISEMARNKFNLNLNTLAPQVSMTNNINDKRGADYAINGFISALEKLSGAY